MRSTTGNIAERLAETADQISLAADTLTNRVDISIGGINSRLDDTGARVESSLGSLEDRIRDSVGTVSVIVDDTGARIETTLGSLGIAFAIASAASTPSSTMPASASPTASVNTRARSIGSARRRRLGYRPPSKQVPAGSKSGSARWTAPSTSASKTSIGRSRAGSGARHQPPWRRQRCRPGDRRGSGAIGRRPFQGRCGFRQCACRPECRVRGLDRTDRIGDGRTPG